MATQPKRVEPDYEPWSKYKEQAWRLHFGGSSEIPSTPSGEDFDELIAFIAPLQEILLFGFDGDPLETVESWIEDWRRAGEEPWQIKWWGQAIDDYHNYLVHNIRKIRADYLIESSYEPRLPVRTGKFQKWLNKDGEAFHLIDHTLDRRLNTPSHKFVGATNKELLRAHSNIIEELKQRGVLRTNNSPAGDYAEWLVAKFFDGELLSMSAKGVDVVTRDGRKIQVKARVVDKNSKKAIQSSAIRDWEFTDLVVVIFDRSDYLVSKAFSAPMEEVKKLVSFAKHDNKNFISDLRSLDKNDNVRDITEELSNFQRKFG